MICPKCNSEVHEGDKFCHSCGCTIEDAIIVNPVCPKCHKQFPTGTVFCADDGTKLTSADKLIARCVKCGKEYGPDVKFCPDDGGQVVAEAYKSNQNSTANTSFIFNGSQGKAPLGVRFIALIIDNIVGSVLSIPAIVFCVLGFIQLSSYNDDVPAIILFSLSVVLLILPTLYFLFKDGMNGGRSIGKRIMGLATIRVEDGKPCTYGNSFARNIIWSLLNSVAMGSLIEGIMVLVTDDGTRLGDKIAKTKVIKTK